MHIILEHHNIMFILKNTYYCCYVQVHITFSQINMVWTYISSFNVDLLSRIVLEGDLFIDNMWYQIISLKT